MGIGGMTPAQKLKIGRLNSTFMPPKKGVITAIAAVASTAITRQMMIHLRVQRPLGQRFLQLVKQAVAVKR